MGANNPKDTYLASAVFLLWMGMLQWVDRFWGWSSLGMSWVIQKDNMLLYAALVFLWFKEDKSVGLILTGIWLVLNVDLIVALLGQMSGFLMPLALMLGGGILYILSKR